MDTSYTNYLDQSTAKRNEANDYISKVPTLRDEGVNKLKAEQDYAGKQGAVDAATKTLYETQRRLEQLPQQAQQRTAGRNVTQGQLDRIIGAESKPLSEQYKSAGLGREQAGQSLSLADKAIQDYVGQFNQDTNLKYKGLMDQALGFMDLFQAGSQESDRQWQRMQAEEEKRMRQEESQRQAALAKQQMALQERIANMNRPVPTVAPTSQAGKGSVIDRIEIDDGGDPVGGVVTGAQKAVPFWQQVLSKAYNKAQSNNQFGGGGLNAISSVWDDTFGRMLNNR